MICVSNPKMKDKTNHSTQQKRGKLVRIFPSLFLILFWQPVFAIEERLDVPYVTTPYEVIDVMLELANIQSDDIVYDLGCGDGRLVLQAIAQGRARRGVGIDLDPRRIEESIENARSMGLEDKVEFRVGDVFETDMSEASVVLFYLLTSVNIRLSPLFLEQLEPGTRLVSHAFGMGDWEPDEERDLGYTKVYFWVVPARISGEWVFTLEGDRSSSFHMPIRQEFQEFRSHGSPAVLLEEGRLEGNRIQFVIEAASDSRLRLLMEGEVDNDIMEGTWRHEETTESGTWKAERVADTRN